MRILYLAIHLFGFGGIQRYSRYQIQALEELVGEDNVTTYLLHPPGDGEYLDSLRLDYIGHGHPPLNRSRFTLRTLQHVAKEKTDIIWSNHVKLLPVAAVASALRTNAVAVGNVYGWEVWSGLRGYERRSLQGASQIVSDCHATADYVRDTLGVSDERLSVIWDPVDIERFVPRRSAERILPKYGVPYRPGACYLMTLGRLSVKARHKGYDRIIDIMKTIMRDDVFYLIAGDGDDRHRLEQRVAQEGLHNRIHFLGPVDEADLVDVYNAADVFVLVSDRGPGRGEGVPLTPLEAAACGKPIIVGDEDGSIEAVNQGVTGYVVSPRRLDDIRSVIINLVEDPVLREDVGQAARKHIIENFSYQAFKDRTSMILDKLMK